MKKNFIENLAVINKMEKEANRLNNTQKNELVDFINEILEETNETISSNHVQFYPEYIGNFKLGETLNKKLSYIVLDNLFPKNKETIVDHYTSIKALENILKGSIRLTSPLKRINDGEYELFYNKHNITGYRDDINKLKTVMKELFYISFTNHKKEFKEETKIFWNEFADNFNGVKIVFEIDSCHHDFREIMYENNNTILHKLSNRINEKYNKPLILSDISNMGAFYIKKEFKHESEIRYHINQFADEYGNEFDFTIKYENEIPYIELDLMSNWGNFNIREIVVGRQENIEKVKSIFSKSKQSTNNIKITVVNK